MSPVAHITICLLIYAVFIVTIRPLSVTRYCCAVAMLTALFILGTQKAQAAPTSEQCSAAADLAGGALEWRQAGISEDVAMEWLRQQKVYSGLPVWAIKQAYKAPADIQGWVLRGSIMSACREREE